MALLLTPGTTLTKQHAGQTWTATATETGYEMAGTTYPSLLACARAVDPGVPRGLCSRTYWGVRPQDVLAESVPDRANGERATAPKRVTGKCQHEGCYEPADCSHGFCKDHCHRHEIGSYSARKTPRSTALHAAVEVEVVYRDADSFRRGVGIDCHRDGSLGQYGAEYKVLAKSTEIAAEVADLVEQLWKRGARVNRSCGLHVHVDARQLPEARKAELRAWACRTQEVWFSLMPPSRQGSSYAKRMEQDPTRDSHFTWFHHTPYDTFEVRLHGGTLNPYKLAGWVTALVHLQAKANEAGYAFPSTGDAEADFWAVFADCPAEGREYLATRKACGGVLRDQAFRHIEE